MNLVSAENALMSKLNAAEGLVARAPQFLAMLYGAINGAEQRGGEGADKLQAVVQAAELYLNEAVPKAMKALQDLLTAVGQFVQQVVALYNEAKVFLHGVGVG